MSEVTLISYTKTSQNASECFSARNTWKKLFSEPPRTHGQQQELVGSPMFLPLLGGHGSLPMVCFLNLVKLFCDDLNKNGAWKSRGSLALFVCDMAYFGGSSRFGLSRSIDAWSGLKLVKS